MRNEPDEHLFYQETKGARIRGSFVSIVVKESGSVDEMADKLLRIAHMARNLKGAGLEEVVSKRLLVHSAKLIIVA